MFEMKCIKPLTYLLQNFGSIASELFKRYEWLRLRSNIFTMPIMAGDGFRVSYANSNFPRFLENKGTFFGGGGVKYLYLKRKFPHAGLNGNILYVVSSSHYWNIVKLMNIAHANKVKVVWNQNGAYFPSAYGHKVAQRGNKIMAPLLHRADYVFYQSRFAQEASDHFLGERIGSYEILYNAVDTNSFRPGKDRLGKIPILLSAGSHNDAYRLPLALDTMKTLLKQGQQVEMIIAGRMSKDIMKKTNKLACEYGLNNLVKFIGPYTQKEAPEIFSRANILLHTQYNDVCPTVVIEAMACGIPVVYSLSGGTPELVGEDAGYGVDSVLNWEEAQPPGASQLAEGILCVLDNWFYYREAARERAVSKFDLKPWIKRHAEVFEYLMGNK